MSDFFHGWRRKTGCVTLAMACVFMGLWFRSHYIEDWLVIPIRSAPTELLSRPSGIAVVTVNGMPPEEYPAQFHWDTQPLDKLALEDPFGSLGTVEWRWDFGGFHFSSDGQSVITRWYVVPYWSIVLPLTLLSAFLLLSKPRPAKRVTMIESPTQTAPSIHP